MFPSRSRSSVFSRAAAVALMSLGLSLFVSGCGKQETTQDKITRNISSGSGAYSLTMEEQQAAVVNATQYYNKGWPQTQTNGSVSQVNGYFAECRNSDSNANGLVTCMGKVPKIEGGWDNVTRYCGYRKDFTGCNDKDVILGQ